MSRLSVTGKVAIVTGGGSGINYAFSKLLLERGCSVVIGDLTLRPEAEELLSKYSHKPQQQPEESDSISCDPSVVFHRTDVRSWPQLSSLFNTCVSTYGRVDIIVPGAGVFEPPSSAFWHPPKSHTNPDTPSQDAADGEPGSYKSLEVNLTHPIRLSQLGISHWTINKVPGTLVHVSSAAGHSAGLAHPLYIASKSGLHAFVRSLGKLRDTLGIRVSAIAPGVVKTPLWNDSNKQLVENMEEVLTSPEAVAEAMLELCMNPDYGDGTILEIMKDNQRVVPLYNADPPPQGKLDVKALLDMGNQVVERLRTEGLKATDPPAANEVLWRGFDDFPDHVFKGTIQDVIWQMREIKGYKYTPGFMAEDSKPSDVMKKINAAVRRNLRKSTDSDDEANVTISCGGEPATAYRVLDGIDYLKALPDTVTCQNGPGPENCGRISCSWTSGIFWCNERATVSDVFPCKQFAGPARDIFDRCLDMHTSQKTLPTVAGYEIDEANEYKVVVARADC
ncbi:hypothetical protein F5Y17DRAFT_456802 [Xylariaceae sp. FL0594]|nr:hypothetical protein F5Y17DRAFT_456802 [Xylariaceae sp. FL0594]